MTSKKHNELLDNELDQVAGGAQQAGASSTKLAGGTENGGLLGRRRLMGGMTSGADDVPEFIPGLLDDDTAKSQTSDAQPVLKSKWYPWS